jgi:uncharacterized membrane-anchored protein YhcB (DUF1043 family)
MWEGALILLAGMAIGGVIAYFAPKYLPTQEKKTESPYDKYKTTEGLYSRKAVKAAKESR